MLLMLMKSAHNREHLAPEVELTTELIYLGHGGLLGHPCGQFLVASLYSLLQSLVLLLPY